MGRKVYNDRLNINEIIQELCCIFPEHYITSFLPIHFRLVQSRIRRPSPQHPLHILHKQPHIPIHRPHPPTPIPPQTVLAPQNNPRRYPLSLIHRQWQFNNPNKSKQQILKNRFHVRLTLCINLTISNELYVLCSYIPNRNCYNYYWYVHYILEF